MPIGQFLAGLRFDPETKRVMGIAFEVARISLRPADRSDLADELIAHNIIYLAKAGERDFDRLCEGGLNVLRKAGSLTVPTPQPGHCGRSCAGWGSGPSCSKTWPRSRQSIQPQQAGQRMKCSASSFG